MMQAVASWQALLCFLVIQKVAIATASIPKKAEVNLVILAERWEFPPLFLCSEWSC